MKHYLNIIKGVSCMLGLSLVLSGCTYDAVEPPESSLPVCATDAVGQVMPQEGENPSLVLLNEAYYQKIKDLIEKYGFFVADDDGIYSGGGDGGVVDCRLIDFDNDETPELVCIYRDVTQNYFYSILIYQFVDKQGEEILNVLSGDELWGDNISSIYFGNLDGKQYLLVAKCSWGESEHVYVYSMESGNLNTKEFYAEIDVTDVAPPVYEYRSCLIDNTQVDTSTYQQKLEEYRQNAKLFYPPDNRECEEFIRKIAQQGGISTQEVNELFEDRGTVFHDPIQ